MKIKIELELDEDVIKFFKECKEAEDMYEFWEGDIGSDIYFTIKKQIEKKVMKNE